MGRQAIECVADCVADCAEMADTAAGFSIALLTSGITWIMGADRAEAVACYDGASFDHDLDVDGDLLRYTGVNRHRGFARSLICYRTAQVDRWACPLVGSENGATHFPGSGLG